MTKKPTPPAEEPPPMALEDATIAAELDAGLAVELGQEQTPEDVAQVVHDALVAAEDTQPFPDVNPEYAVENFLINWTLNRDPRECNAISAANAFYGGSVSTPQQFDLVRRVWRRMYPGD